MEIKATTREREHPDPKGKSGPVGLCPRCGRQKIKWNPQTDVSRCEFCGWTNGIRK